MKFEYEIGEEVHDLLTKEKTKIIGQSYSKKTTNDQVEYIVDNEYNDGHRHPWEIKKL